MIILQNNNQENKSENQQKKEWKQHEHKRYETIF